MSDSEFEAILASRARLPRPEPRPERPEAEGGCGVVGLRPERPEAEGGCGVVGLISNRAVPGSAVAGGCATMRNRGNGKGGGVAIGGLDPAALGVSADVLRDDYLLAVAYLEPEAKPSVEAEFIRPFFDVHAEGEFAHLADYRELGLPIKPPAVKRYFVRVKSEVLDRFCRESAGRLPEDRYERERWEDEFVFQNSYRLNVKHYASLGKKAAFVLSHAKDLLVLKLVGYAEDAIRYYRIEGLEAKLWIGHQRYPTKGRLWHPGGAHPFIGMHEALVHNGDFANYARVVKYLKGRNLTPLFLTDTEVSVLLFDLWTRTYRYPLEMAIEAMAPTTERDFELLPPQRQAAYRAVQAASMKGSPDGPWFFIIAKSDQRRRELQLLGVTDTSMLRPQVFALQDHAWRVPPGRLVEPPPAIGLIGSEKQAIDRVLDELAAAGLPFKSPADRYWNARGGSYSHGGDDAFSLDAAGRLAVADKFGNRVEAKGPEPKLELAFGLGAEAAKAKAELRVEFASSGRLGNPPTADALLEVDATGFGLEGPAALSAFLAHASRLGWRRFRVLKTLGHRFIGCGLPQGINAELDVHGSPGDYLASGLSGGVIRVFNSAQDQVGQIMAGGRLVVYGDVGQTFLYGAKGGECFILGNAAGRPLINAVGRPRVVINGTCLDYLAESFMAGDPLKGGGFCVVNGIRYTGGGKFSELDTPYPGGNLFSLASGGAIYFRDPARRLTEDQLNGGRLADLLPTDWDLIRPYLEENERLFGIPVSALLSWQAEVRKPSDIYLKIVPTRLKALTVAHD